MVVALDDLVGTGSIPPPDVIKVDVEGGERDVFAGAVRTIGAHMPFIIFESDVNMRRFGYGRRELVADITRIANYDFMFVAGDELIAIGANLDCDTYSDLIAVPRSARRDRLTLATKS